MKTQVSNIFSLSTLLALLMTRLPGTKTNGSSLIFRCYRKVYDAGRGVRISANLGASLSWLSEAVNGITMQSSGPEHNWNADEDYTSKVKVERKSSSEFRLKNLKPRVEQRLLNGEGRYTIVTVDIDKTEDGHYKKMGNILVQGRGNGVWEILR